MSPRFFTHLATRLFSRRWWFFAVSMLGTALLFAAFSSGSARAAAVAGTLAGPVIFVPWALLCACVWFHPQRGTLQPGSRLIRNLPNAFQIGVRWYASLFLTMFAVVGAIVWPALSLAWL
jgi:hypothetical protein